MVDQWGAVEGVEADQGVGGSCSYGRGVGNGGGA